MRKPRLLLVVLLAGVLVAFGYQRYREHQDLIRHQQLIESYQRVHELQVATRRVLDAHFVDNLAATAMPAAYGRPTSEWSANEKRLYQKILSSGQYDVLVAPLQINGWAFDRATRSLMTAELTAAIARSQSGKVPDPYVVTKVVGEGLREFPLEELYEAANSIGAKRVIWGAVGHDRKGRMKITVISQLRPENGSETPKWQTPTEVHSLTGIAFNDEHTAIDAFEQSLPEIVNSLGLTPAAVSKPKSPGKLDIGELPLSPLSLMTNNDNPSRNAYAFLLLGLLTPASMESTREQFVEKALLAISQMSVDAPEYPALRARALMMMSYRVAALKSLGTASSNEEKEVQAVLAGNLPEVRVHADSETNPLKRFIAQLDVNRIAADYGVVTTGQSIAAVKALNLPGQVWPYLAARKFTEWDSRSQYDNASLKLVLDHELPLKSYSLEELVRGAASIGGTDTLRNLVDLSVFNHTQRYLEAQATQCCQRPAGRFDAFDYLELLSAIGNDNLVRHITWLCNMQGLSRAAIQYADSIQSVYSGYPDYALARGAAELQTAGESDGAERDALLKRAFENVFNAMYWEQSQSEISSQALFDLGNFRQYEYGYFDNFYSYDLPYHPLYNSWANGGDLATAEANGMAGLANATSEFGTVLALAGDDRPKVTGEAFADEVVRRMQGRFIGSPQRAQFLAHQELRRGNTTAAAALLREAISIAPGLEDAYFDLGDLLFMSGQPGEAARVFHSYPRLQEAAGGDRLLVANAAYEMGSIFYGSGDFELASPFFTISSSQGTGSAREMTAAMRLKLLGGDVNGALLSSLERAQRYGESRAYRDYLSLLQATRHSREAWAGFSALVRELQEPHIWESALVGHHMAGNSEAEVIDWVKQGEFHNAGTNASYAITYLARFATTDRIPSKELATVIDELDRPVWQFDESHEVVRPAIDGQTQRVLGPLVPTEGVLPLGVFESVTAKHRVRSPLSYFVEGYRAIKLGNFREARRVFDEAAGLYDMTSPQTSYMLPYYGLATVKGGGDVSAVEKVLARLSTQDQLFEYQLTKAVLEGLGGKQSEALASLKLARYRRPDTDDRLLLTRFAYGDICESLYRETGNAEILRIALDWAQRSEKAEPWQSWSYALEASLTPDPLARKRAIAMTYYLDPKSVHLTLFKKSEIDDAIAATPDSVNIFLERPVGEVKGKSTT